MGGASSTGDVGAGSTSWRCSVVAPTPWGSRSTRLKVATYAGPAGRVIRGDLQALPIAEHQFDVALLNEVLEHVPDDRAVLSEMFRVLKPGGTLMIFSPSRRYPLETHGLLWRGTGRVIPPWWTLGVPYLPVWLGQRWFDYPARNYWPSELRRLVTSVGFTVTRTTYLWQTFENITRRQPGWVRRGQPLLRWVSGWLGKTPGIRTLGVSQVLGATKPGPPPPRYWYGPRSAAP